VDATITEWRHAATDHEEEQMESAETPTRASRRSFRAVDAWLESVLGADMRLLYGVIIPMVLVVDVLVLLTFKQYAWLVAILMLIEIGALLLVIYGFMEMLDDEDAGEDDLAHE
jgi:hypothetical protein